MLLGKEIRKCSECLYLDDLVSTANTDAERVRQYLIYVIIVLVVRLIYAGRQLEGGDIETNKLPKEATIQLLLRLRGD
jgi:hypothetical protein